MAFQIENETKRDGPEISKVQKCLNNADLEAKRRTESKLLKKRIKIKLWRARCLILERF